MEQTFGMLLILNGTCHIMEPLMNNVISPPTLQVAGYRFLAVSGGLQSSSDVVQTPRESGARRRSMREPKPNLFRRRRYIKLDDRKDVLW